MKDTIRYLIPMALMAAAAAAAGCAAAQNAPSPGGAPAVAAPVRPAVPAPPAAPTLVGIAQITLKVSNLEKSRFYYNKVLGLPQAFELKDRAGKVTSVYYKVNDEQFIEIVPGLQPGDNVREARLVVQSSDLPKLRETYVERGLNPGPITIGPDGNPNFRIVLPNGFPMDFLQYVPTSKQGMLRGKLLTPERISTHLLHAGTMVADDATKAVWPKLGLGRPLGTRGDYLETPTSDRNLETKNPPLDPENPATKAQYTREVYGAVYHFSLEIEDMWTAREILKQRGGFDDVRLRTASGNNRHWLIHLFDPDGTRAELMSKDEVPADVTPFSVMPPGPKGQPVILTKERGVYPWP